MWLEKFQKIQNHKSKKEKKNEKMDEISMGNHCVNSDGNGRL